MTPGADGYDSSPYSKLFARFLQKTGVKTRRNGFHSLRHSFSDATRRSMMPDTLRKRLMGHEDASTTEGHYGAGYDKATLTKAMSEISFDGLKLDGLYPQAIEAKGTRAANESSPMPF